MEGPIGLNIAESTAQQVANRLTLFSGIMGGRGRLSRIGVNWFTGNPIVALNPPTQVDELAALRTEGTKGIVFSLDWFTAGWTSHG